MAVKEDIKLRAAAAAPACIVFATAGRKSTGRKSVQTQTTSSGHTQPRTAALNRLLLGSYRAQEQAQRLQQRAEGGAGMGQASSSSCPPHPQALGAPAWPAHQVQVRGTRQGPTWRQQQRQRRAWAPPPPQCPWRTAWRAWAAASPARRGRGACPRPRLAHAPRV